MAKRKPKARATRIDNSASNNLTTEQQFQQEYAYVIKDLRRIFVLAAVMFTLLIVLNIVLR